MLKVKSIKQRLADEHRKNQELLAKLNVLEANTDYIAMMSDIELETEDESEVTDNE